MTNIAGSNARQRLSGGDRQVGESRVHGGYMSDFCTQCTALELPPLYGRHALALSGRTRAVCVCVLMRSHFDSLRRAKPEMSTQVSK